MCTMLMGRFLLRVFNKTQSPLFTFRNPPVQCWSSGSVTLRYACSALCVQNPYLTLFTQGENSSYNGLYFTQNELKNLVDSNALCGTPIKTEHVGNNIGTVVSGFLNEQGQLQCVMELDGSVEGSLTSGFVRNGIAADLVRACTVMYPKNTLTLLCHSPWDTPSTWPTPKIKSSKPAKNAFWKLVLFAAVPARAAMSRPIRTRDRKSCMWVKVTPGLRSTCSSGPHSLIRFPKWSAWPAVSVIFCPYYAPESACGNSPASQSPVIARPPYNICALCAIS